MSDGGLHLALQRAPQSAVLERARGGLRARSLPARTVQRARPLRVPAVQRGQSQVGATALTHPHGPNSLAAALASTLR